VAVLRYVSRQDVVGVGKVDSCGADLVELLAVPGDGVGQVDDVEDLGAAEAGDLHGSHAWRLGQPAEDEGRSDQSHSGGVPGGGCLRRAFRARIPERHLSSSR